MFCLIEFISLNRFSMEEGVDAILVLGKEVEGYQTDANQNG